MTNKYAINVVTMDKVLLSDLFCKGVRHIADILIFIKYTLLYLTCY